jgi:protoheme IX farnesyltransferase
LWFGLLLTLGGLVYLWLTVNLLSAAVTALIAVSYLFFYTPMKLRSSLCVLVGAVPGALPPVIGWVAATGNLDVGAWVLFAIIFLWQVPHTLAIGRLYREDYARAGIQFLAVIDMDGESTNRQILCHTAALLAVSLIDLAASAQTAVRFVNLSSGATIDNGVGPRGAIMDLLMKGARIEAHKRRRFGLYLGLVIALYVGAVIFFIIAY